MLKVHMYSSTFTPFVFAGTRKQVMPRASPSLPEVRANSAQWVATCMPVVHIFSPSMTHPETPSRVACTARVSMWVASEPCSGSVRPKVMRYFPVIEPSIIAFFNRLDVARDESVELGEIGDQVGRQCKIQGNSPRDRFCRCGEFRAETLRNSIKVRSPSQVKQPKRLVPRRRPAQFGGAGEWEQASIQVSISRHRKHSREQTWT